MDSPSPSARPSTSATLFDLKAQASELQLQAKARGEVLKRGAALEAVARRHGFRDWNAAAAAVAVAPMLNTTLPERYPFEAVDDPLPRRPFRIRNPGDEVYDQIQELYRWAQQLEFIATKVGEDDRRAALDLVGGQRPYVFVLDPNRWTDGLFHLCDRGYDPLDGIALSLEELRSVGVAVWEERYGSHGGSDMYSVLSDDVVVSSNDVQLRQAARLLIAVALAVDAKVYGPAPASPRRT